MPRKLWMMGVWPQGLMRNVVCMMPANFCAVGHAQLACGLRRAVVADWRSAETIQKSGLKPRDFDCRCLSAKPPIKSFAAVGVTRRAVDRIGPARSKYLVGAWFGDHEKRLNIRGPISPIMCVHGCHVYKMLSRGHSACRMVRGWDMVMIYVVPVDGLELIRVCLSVCSTTPATSEGTVVNLIPGTHCSNPLLQTLRDRFRV